MRLIPWAVLSMLVELGGCANAPAIPPGRASAPAPPPPVSAGVPVQPTAAPAEPAEPVGPTPETVEPPSPAAQAAAPPAPPLKRKPPTSSAASPAAGVKPPPAAAPPTPPPAAAQAPVQTPATATAQSPAQTQTLDLTSLEQRLRDTRAIGLFTKLSLKNQVDDLLAQFREFYDGRSKMALPDLHQRYDLLLMKVLSLLQNADPPLAADIAASRNAIWSILADPKKFAKWQT